MAQELTVGLRSQTPAKLKDFMNFFADFRSCVMYLHQCVLCLDIDSKSRNGMHNDTVLLLASWHTPCPKAPGDETAWDLPPWVKQTLKAQDCYLVK